MQRGVFLFKSTEWLWATLAAVSTTTSQTDAMRIYWILLVKHIPRLEIITGSSEVADSKQYVRIFELGIYADNLHNIVLVDFDYTISFENTSSFCCWFWYDCLYDDRITSSQHYTEISISFVHGESPQVQQTVGRSR